MTEAVTEVTQDELQRLHLFHTVDLKTIEPLLRSCPVRSVSVGETLIAAGQPNHFLFALLSGQLGIRLGSVASDSILTLHVGESVGELSLIDHNAASAFVVAEAPSRVLVVDEELLWMLVNTSHAVSSNLLHTLAARLRSGNDMIFRDRETLEEYRFQATIDPVTGLYNRRWLQQMLSRQIDRSRSNAEPLSLLMLDIDHFKRFNDTYGHLAGDYALGTVAQNLVDNLRPADMASRYGGEEFVVLLPDSDLNGARLAAERLRVAVERAPVNAPGQKEICHVSISLGIAELLPEYDENSFLQAADKALYRAKEAGRNRISD